MDSKNRLGKTFSFGPLLLLSLGVSGAAALVACGDDAPPPGGSSSSSVAASGSSSSGGEAGGAGGTGGTGGAGGGTAGGGGAGGGNVVCGTPATGSVRGSAIAMSPDETHLINVNRDVGTVTVMSVSYADGSPAMTKVAELNLGAGSEPWEVVVDGCGEHAYVTLRKDQKVVRIDGLNTASPTVGPSVSVGSEPTGITLTPNNTRLYVANWVDGTLSVIDTLTMAVTNVVDLNTTLAETGLLGTLTARASLAHPRALVVTNNGDANDMDETVYATEWFAQRTGPETIATADTNKKGLVYAVGVGGTPPKVIDLPPIVDTGFPDFKGEVTGCFPNQVGTINVEGGFAYVTSTCASPKGPIGVFAGKNLNGVCTVATQAADCGTVGGVCNAATLKCNPNTTGVKTTTHPALTIIDLATQKATETIALDKRFSDKASGRMPLLPTDLGFFNKFGYLSADGTDAVFRLVVDNGQVTDVGSATNKFINLRKDANDKLIRNPIGIAMGKTKAFAFVANDGSRDVTALALNTQAIAGDGMVDFRITQASALPAAGSAEDAALRGKRFFTTGLGRWSLNGEGWGSCAVCHIDGLSDNVSWYFARGPRQSVSLDGSFASNDPLDQRIFNWTAIFDEVADFELNTRGVSGGLGAIVDAADKRIDLAAEVPQQQGLQGSTSDIADPMGMSPHPHSVLNDFEEMEDWIRTLRSPRRPTNLVQADVDAGRTIFSDPAQGNCVGCHSGAKWTISKRFYTPGDLPNAATADMAATSLSSQTWNTMLNGFPSALFPADPLDPAFAVSARMRFGAPPGAEQLQCALRPVGTFAVSPAAVSVLELRQDMTTAGQGNGALGRGFNVPSLLGAQVGAPYFHGGNARTLEEVFDDTLFKSHHQSAVAQVFVMNDTKKRQLVAFVLSIDEDEAKLASPAKGSNGGDLCFYTP